jgi:four helix bundle protein
MKRAAVSIRLNVVEGAACESPNEFSRFLEIAYRSARETLTCIELTAELELCKVELISKLIETADRLAGAIYSYRRTVKASSAIQDSDGASVTIERTSIGR